MLVVADALVPARVVALLSGRPRTLGATALAKIRDAIVEVVAVSVVDPPRWPPAMHVEPRESSRRVVAPIDPDIEAPWFLDVPGGKTGTMARLPREDSSAGIVPKDFLQPFDREALHRRMLSREVSVL